MLPIQTIRELHKSYWKKGFGSISAKEAFFLQMGIAQHKPRRVIEIGTASGLSTGFIALFMHENNGSELTTLDLDTTFWLDRSKSTGYLAEQIYPHGNIKINYIRGKNSSCIPEHLSQGKFDMGFIDANHQHPWPTLDMICLLPAMEKACAIYHHDLSLYKNQNPIYGIGPKYLFDQVSDDMKEVTSEPEANIFFLRTPDNYADMQQAMIDSLYLPWTIRQKIDISTIQSIAKLAHTHWSQELSDVIHFTANKFNSR